MPKEGGKGADPDDPSCNGIPIGTDRAIFALGTSESMSYSSVNCEEPAKPGELSHLETAKCEFCPALIPFNSKGLSTVIVFHWDVQVWNRQLVPDTEEMNEQAKARAKRLEPTGTTDIQAALRTAFSLAGTDVRDKRYDLAADTDYLLSDWAPTNDDYSDGDPGVILRAVRNGNRLRRVKIHTMGSSAATPG